MARLSLILYSVICVSRCGESIRDDDLGSASIPDPVVVNLDVKVGNTSASEGSAKEPTGISYKLFYYPITNAGEAIRMVFALSETPFEDNRIKHEETPPSAFGELPVLQITEGGSTLTLGGSYTQAAPILRYLGKIFTYQHKPLYPVSPMEAYFCDEILGATDDARRPIYPSLAQDERVKLMEKGGTVYNVFEKIDARIAGRVFAAGDTVSVADLYLLSIMNMYEQPTFWDGLKENGMAPFQNLIKLRQAVVSLPPLVAYYKDAPEHYRAQFKPK